MRNKIIKLIFLPLSLLIAIFVMALRPFFIIRFCFIPDVRVGHLLHDIAVYLIERDLQKKNKTKLPFDVFCFGDPKFTSNNFIKEKWSKKLFVVTPHIVIPVKKILKLFCEILNYKNFHEIYLASNSSYNTNILNLVNNSSYLLEFSDMEKKKGELILQKLGIPKGEKYILLIIRDVNYLKTIFPNNDWSYWDYRNQNIENFLELINDLVNKGYYVVRLGKNVSKELSLKHPKIIDYPYSDHTSDFFDIYLCANCYFCITTDTGINFACKIFNRPMLGIEYPTFEPNIVHHCDLITLPMFYDENNKKILTLDELLKKVEDPKIFNSMTLKKFNLKLIHNTSEEIKNAGADMIKHLSKSNDNYDDQNKFWDRIVSHSNSKTNSIYKGKIKAKVCKSFYTKYNQYLEK
mgnify:CR=1 FL=1|tara:strand:+ start:560 stop:1777 length:1218 start_codon:yes stop_codon:yes gene_type:complete